MVSIIIPTYNQSDFLHITLLELVSQLGSCQLAYEILIVDNSDKEDSDFQRKFHECHYWHKPDYQNPYVSRNYAAGQSKGEWLLFLDSKSEPYKNYVERLAIHIREVAADLVGGEVRVSVTKGDSNLALAHAVLYLRTSPKNFRDRASALTTNMLVKRSVFDALGGFKETRSGNDVEFVARARAAGYKIIHDPDLAVSYPAKTPAEVISFLRRIAKNGQNKVGLLSLRPPNPKPINMRLEDLGLELGRWKYVQLYVTVWYVRWLKYIYQYI